MHNPLIGILGGMGPLASAGFINLLYQKCRSKFSEEQNYPRIILLSDSTIPDRLACIASHVNTQKLVMTLENNIQKLLKAGAEQIFICCFTAHYFLKLFSTENQKNIINLGALLTEYLDKERKPTLILCSELLAKSRLIASPYAVYPDQIYFDKIHRLIYKIKLHGPALYQSELVALAQSLSKLYYVSHVLFACTEFHLIYQNMRTDFIQDNQMAILDGLDIAANYILKEQTK